MKSIKTITFSLPIEMGRDIEEMAQQEQRTVSELIREAVRQYRAQRSFKSLVKKGKAAAKKKGFTANTLDI
jgi:CopG family transcriptional regulator/antitoxin EndoAI